MTPDLKTLRSVATKAARRNWTDDDMQAFDDAFRPQAVLSLLDRIEELEGALAKIGSGSFPDAVNLALGGGWHTFVDRLQEIARAALHPEPLGEGGGL